MIGMCIGDLRIDVETVIRVDSAVELEGQL